MRALERGRQGARSALALELGELEIATVLSMAVGVLPMHVGVWHERHPNISIRIHEFRHRNLLEDAVEQGVADFAVGPRPMRRWDGPLETVTWEEFVLVVAEHRPACGSKRRRARRARASANGCSTTPITASRTSSTTSAGTRASVPRGTVRTSQAEGAVRLAAAGVGVALVPDNIVSPGHRLHGTPLPATADPRHRGVRAERLVADRGCVRRRPPLEPSRAPCRRCVDRALRVSTMEPMRFAPLALVALLLAGCGGSSSHKATSTTTTITTPVSSPSFAAARARTTRARPSPFQAADRGTCGRRHRHGRGERHRLVHRAARASLQADPRLPGSRRAGHARPVHLREREHPSGARRPIGQAVDEARHATPDRRATANAGRTSSRTWSPRFISPTACAVARQAGRAANGTTRFTGVVDPARLARRVPPSVRASISTAVANDYAATPFPGDVLAGRPGAHPTCPRRLPHRRRDRGSSSTPRTAGFGSKVDVTLPAADDIADVSP